MKRIILSILFLMGCGMASTAQNGGFNSDFIRQKQQDGNSEMKSTATTVEDRKLSSTNEFAANSILQTTSDKSVAYYQHVTRQNGWYVGIGPALTKEQASHLNVVYKFSNKNNAGHWLKLEALDGYGNLTNEHSLIAYIADANSINDTTINEEWFRKTNHVCQWELMPDGSGKTVVVERAYDKGNQLIYNYQPVFISDKEIIGSYTDSWGLPAKMYVKETKPINIYVNILLDRWGNDSIIKFVDTDGYLLKNHVGSWMIRNICNRNGLILETFSLNQLGLPMNDNAGNCSCRAEYDKYGNTTHITYYDAGGNPIRISGDNFLNNVVEERREYDRWHREISLSFFSGNEPDTTNQGVHKIERTYNSHGQILSMKSTGRDGKPREYGEERAAYVYNTYDGKGRLLSITRLNSDSVYYSSDCKMEWGYNDNGICQYKLYSFSDNFISLSKMETYSKYVNTFYDKEMRMAYVDSLDEKGNLLMRKYVHPDENPIVLLNSKPSYHYPYVRRTSTYEYFPHKCIETTTFFDDNGSWVGENSSFDGVAHKVITTDSVLHTIVHTEYTKDSVLTANYMEIYDDSFNKLKFKQSLTTTGEKGRSGFGDGLYYKAKIDYTPTGKVASVQYFNEFDEPAMVYDNFKCYCYQVNDEKGTVKYYDEYKNLVEDYNYRDKKTAMTVELLNEKGKASGLQNGDIVIRYGDWFFNQNHYIYYDYEQLYSQMVFACGKDTIDMWVLRHFPENRNSRIIKLRVKGERPMEMGFVVNKICLTDKEYMRLLQTYSHFKLEEENIVGTNGDNRRQFRHMAQIILPDLKEKRLNPAILLVEKKYENVGWPSTDSRTLTEYNYGEDYKYRSSNSIIYYSENGKDVLRTMNHWINTFYVYLSDEEHEIAMKLLENAKQDSSPFDTLFDSQRRDYISYTLESQPDDNAIPAETMISLLLEGPASETKGVRTSVFNHVEGLNTMKALKVYTYSGEYSTKYRTLTYQLDKAYYTSRIIPKDTTDISNRGIVFLHETPTCIDEILFMSQDTVLWAKGNMPFATKEIIRKNMYGEKCTYADYYNQQDLDVNDNAGKLQIATFWQNHHVYLKSIPVLKALSKKKYAKAYIVLAEAFVKGEGVPVDTARAIALYEKAIKVGEPVQRRLGWLYYDTRQYKQALNCLKYNTDPEAYYAVGLIYENGYGGVKENLDSSLFYYNKGLILVESENYSVRWKYSDSVYRVSGKIKYHEEDLVELASEIAQTMSKDSLYEKYLEISRSRDEKKAFPYLKAAADSLYPAAEADMAEYMIDPQYPYKDQKMAYDYLQRAVRHYLEYAQHGDSSAYYSIAELYRCRDVEGSGTDMNKAISYYKLGMQHNHVLSATELGAFYFRQFDYENALNAYLVGAKAGDADCMYQVAFLYELGASGLEGNKFQAINWYRHCYNTIAKSEEKSRLSQNALQRLGVPIEQKTDMYEMVGIWISQTGSYPLGKVFLPNGKYFGFRYRDGNYISEIRDMSFTPWMMGDYYLKGMNRYVEDVKLRDNPSYLGEQELTVRIDNDIMYNSWHGMPESWKRIDDNEGLIDYIMQNWKAYSDSMTKILQYKSEK